MVLRGQGFRNTRTPVAAAAAGAGEIDVAVGRAWDNNETVERWKLQSGVTSK